MSALSAFLRAISGWLARAVPPQAEASPAPEDRQAAEARRKSIHDVTLEQFGIAHWSSHTLF